MKKAVAVLGIIFAAVAIAAVDLPQSGDVVRIGDWEYVLLKHDDYVRIAVAVEDLQAKWTAANSNEAGRVAFHGARGHTTITNGYVEVEYADGYRHRVKASDVATPRKAARKANVADVAPRTSVVKTATPPSLPPALSRLRNERKTPKSVTVEMGVK